MKVRKVVVVTTVAAVVPWVCALVASVSILVRQEPSIPLALSVQEWSAGGDAVTTDVSVATSQPWSAVDDQPWLEVTPASGRRGATVQLSASPNTTGQVRSATLTVTSAGAEQTMVVRQAVRQVPPELDVYDWDVTSKGGETTIEVTATGSWTAQSDQDWAQAQAEPETSNLRLSAAENTGQARTAMITVTDTMGSTQLAISQAGPDDEPVLHLSLKAWKPKAAAASRSVEVTCVEPWVATTDQTWLSLNPSSADGDATMEMSVPANTGTKSRTATVEVSCGVQALTVTVTQAGAASFRSPLPSPFGPVQPPVGLPSASPSAVPATPTNEPTTDPTTDPKPPPPVDPEPPPPPVDPEPPPPPVDPEPPPDPEPVDPPVEPPADEP